MKMMIPMPRGERDGLAGSASEPLPLPPPALPASPAAPLPPPLLPLPLRLTTRLRGLPVALRLGLKEEPEVPRSLAGLGEAAGDAAAGAAGASACQLGEGAQWAKGERVEGKGRA